MNADETRNRNIFNANRGGVYGINVGELGGGGKAGEKRRRQARLGRYHLRHNRRMVARKPSCDTKIFLEK